ncbi:MAG: bacillithiol transferase BstA [Bryobacteraceae bacterium]|nr:bacillithiol transferase BstA [Bryobacteraceae bacterium]
MDPRYPIGQFADSADRSPERRQALIRDLANLPAQLRAATNGLGDAQFDTPYREGGWTVRQVVHHLPDSHVNAYIRTRWALTEESPMIKAYDEVAWAELSDAKLGPIEPSLALLQALHLRWVQLWKSLPEEAYSRVFRHPESGENSLARQLELYSWHGKHHLAHITTLRQQKGW